MFRARFVFRTQRLCAIPLFPRLHIFHDRFELAIAIHARLEKNHRRLPTAKEASLLKGVHRPGQPFLGANPLVHRGEREAGDTHGFPRMLGGEEAFLLRAR